MSERHFFMFIGGVVVASVAAFFFGIVAFWPKPPNLARDGILVRETKLDGFGASIRTIRHGDVNYVIYEGSTGAAMIKDPHY